MTWVYNKYKSIFDTFIGDATNYRVEHLTEKLMNRFGTELSLSKSTNKENNVLHCSKMDSDDVILSAIHYINSFEYKVTKVALHMRISVLQL